MEKYLKHLIICSIVFISGCSTTTDYRTYEPQPLEIESYPEYAIDLDSIQKPEPPNITLVRVDGNTIQFIDDNSELEPTHVVIPEEDLSKLEGLLDLTITYKNIINSQSELLNTQINITNLYIDRLRQERELTRQYYFLWKQSEEMYRQERKDHRIDLLLNRASMIITVIGGVAVGTL